jgi:prepilin-type N-terminal cleavage/methylation domain-containing protein
MRRRRRDPLRLSGNPVSQFSTFSFLFSTSRASARSAFTLPMLRARSAFTLIELLVVMGIISVLLVVAIPAITSLSKAHSQKAAISNVMNLFEQARSLAVTTGNATYVVFADPTTPENYRDKAYIVFKEDSQTFSPAAVTKWYFLPTGISFQPNTGLLTPPTGAPPLKFSCPGTIGPAAVALPFIKFDSNGMVASPTDPNILFVSVFAGSVDQNGVASFTDLNQKSTQKFDKIAIARFTGRARYVDPYP